MSMQMYRIKSCDTVHRAHVMRSSVYIGTCLLNPNAAACKIKPPVNSVIRSFGMYAKCRQKADKVTSIPFYACIKMSSQINLPDCHHVVKVRYLSIDFISTLIGFHGIP